MASCKILKRQLADALLAVDHVGDVSVGGIADELPSLPGISVQGVGPVSFPLTPVMAEKIKEVGRIAPFGRGLETVVDEKVRKSWEIGADKISFRNPRWDDRLSGLVDRVTEELDCGGKVQAILYKALLYEKGGHFSFHRDTEKEKRMFATLIIQLPSDCKGGSLVTRHAGKEKTFDFGASTGLAEFAAHYAAHYADVEHSVQEVTEGYRFVLIYSLCWQSSCTEPPCATQRSSQVIAVSNAIQAMCDAGGDELDETCVGILLEHQYTGQGTENFGASALKGQDRILYNALSVVNRDLDKAHKIRLFLVPLSRRESYYGEDIDDYEMELGNSEDHIGPWMDECGKKFEWGSGIRFGFEDLMCLDASKEVNVDDTEWWGKGFKENEQPYTGNNAPSREQVYYRFALVFYPLKTEFQRLLTQSGALCGISLLLEDVAAPGTLSEEDRKLLHARSDMVLQAWVPSKRENNKEIANVFASFAVQLGSVEVATKFLQKLLAMIEHDEVVFSDLLECLTCMVKGFGWDRLSHLILPIIVKLPNRFQVATQMLRENLVEDKKSLAEAMYQSWTTTSSKDANGLMQEFVFFELSGGDPVQTGAVADAMSTCLSELEMQECLQELTAGKISPIPVTETALRLLLTHRYDRVKGIVDEGRPPLDWRMPEAPPSGYTAVTNFLRGPEKTHLYDRVFYDFGDAYSFASRNFGYSRDTITSSVSYTGERAVVSIVKKVHKDVAATLQTYQTEKAKLEELLGIGEQAGDSQQVEKKAKHSRDSEMVIGESSK